MLLCSKINGINHRRRKERINKILFINSYKENKVKNIILKEEEVQEKENKPEINEELLNTNFNTAKIQKTRNKTNGKLKTFKNKNTKTKKKRI